MFETHVNWASNGPIVLVEGVFDHFVTSQSYALMGSNITPDQIKRLIKDNVERAFVIGDPDADNAAQGICKKLLDYYVLAYPVRLIGTNKDPADLGREIMDKVVDELISLPKIRGSQQLRIDIANLWGLQGQDY